MTVAHTWHHGWWYHTLSLDHDWQIEIKEDQAEQIHSMLETYACYFAIGTGNKTAYL